MALRSQCGTVSAYTGSGESTDDLANDLGAVCAIGEDESTGVLGRDEEGVGVRSRVGIGVVDDGDAVVDDDLPAEAHADEDMAGTAGNESLTLKIKRFRIATCEN